MFCFSLFSCKFDYQFWPKFLQVFFLYTYSWDTPSEKTGIWQLQAKAFSAFKFKYYQHNYSINMTLVVGIRGVSLPPDVNFFINYLFPVSRWKLEMQGFSFGLFLYQLWAIPTRTLCKHDASCRNDGSINTALCKVSINYWFVLFRCKY